MSVENPEWDTISWAAYKNLNNIELLFRRVDDLEWHSALNPTGGRIYIPIRVPTVCLNCRCGIIYLIMTLGRH